MLGLGIVLELMRSKGHDWFVPAMYGTLLTVLLMFALMGNKVPAWARHLRFRGPRGKTRDGRDVSGFS